MFKTLHPDASTAVVAKAPLAQPSSWTASQLWAATLVFIGLATAALNIDLPLARYIHAHGLPDSLRQPVRLAETFGWGGTVFLIILTAAVLDSRGWRVAWRLAGGALGAGLVADGAKLLIARLRPAAAELGGHVQDTFVAWLPLLTNERLGRAYGHALQSFPSAHAATATGLAIGLAALYPRGRWLFVTFAFLACVQRIEAQAHFTSDVLAGAALGCGIGAILARSASEGMTQARSASEGNRR